MEVNNVKVIVIGNRNVGKTTMINRWSEDFFNPCNLPTISVGIYNFAITLDGVDYLFHVWDTPGHEGCRNATVLSFHDARSAMIVFDTTQRSTFLEIPQWIELLKSRTPDIPFVIVGNKCDLISQDYQAQHYIELQELAKRYNCQIFFTSAFNGVNIEESFQTLAALAVQPNKSETLNNNCNGYNTRQNYEASTKSMSQHSNVVDLESSSKCVPNNCCKS